MINELLVLHHTHTDIGYTHPQPVIWEIMDRHLDEAIELCEATADFPEDSRMKWTCEVTSTFLHWLERASPRQVRRLQQRVNLGQISFGAMWGHWTALASEDALRESLAPIRRIREQFGAPVGVAIQHDVNGAAWPVGDMLLDHGVSHLVFAVNVHMGAFPLTRPLMFRWETPSGRQVRVFSGEHYNAFTREARLRDRCLDRMSEGLQEYFVRLKAKGWNRDFAFLTATHPFMDDNNPPNPDLPRIIRQWNEEGRSPRIRLVTPEQLAARMDREDDSTVPVHRGDWTDYWSFGVAASALDVVLSRRGHAAWWTARALAAGLPPEQRDTATGEAALHHLHCADEHTWNVFSTTPVFCPGASFDPVSEAEQRVPKSNYCAGAHTLSRLWRRNLLHTVAGNPRQCANRGLLVVNPSEVERTVCLRVPNEVLRDETPLIEGTRHRLDAMENLLTPENATLVGPVRLPPFALVRRPMSAFPPAQPTGCQIGPDAISSPHWALRFDPKTGRIGSLRRVAGGRECHAPDSGWDFFGAVRETIASPSPESIAARDARFDFYELTLDTCAQVHADMCCWNRDWPARHEGPSALLRCETFLDGEGAHLVRRFAMPGVLGELRQTLTLPAHEDRIRCEAYFNKADDSNPEGMYFTFPFALPGARAHFDAAGQPVEYDRDQLPGACRDFVTAGSWIASESGAGCLVIACPDAPLFQIGGFHFGRGITRAKDLDASLLLAWPMNNYWNTNFRVSQPGFIQLRYEIAWFDAFDSARCARFAAAVQRPPVFHPVADATPLEGVLFSPPGGSTTVSSLVPADHGPAALLRDHRTHTTFLTSPTPRVKGETK